MSQSRARDTTGTIVVKAQPNLSLKGSGGQQQGWKVRCGRNCSSKRPCS